MGKSISNEKEDRKVKKTCFTCYKYRCTNIMQMLLAGKWSLSQIRTGYQNLADSCPVYSKKEANDESG